MPELKPNVNYEGAIRQVEDCMHSVFNKGVKWGRYLERQAMRKRQEESIRLGEWETNSLFPTCSHCECVNLSKTNYCPNCGAQMFRKVEKDAE